MLRSLKSMEIWVPYGLSGTAVNLAKMRRKWQNVKEEQSLLLCATESGPTRISRHCMPVCVHSERRTHLLGYVTLSAAMPRTDSPAAGLELPLVELESVSSR